MSEGFFDELLEVVPEFRTGSRKGSAPSELLVRLLYLHEQQNS